MKTTINDQPSKPTDYPKLMANTDIRGVRSVLFMSSEKVGIVVWANTESILRVGEMCTTCTSGWMKDYNGIVTLENTL